MDENQRWRLLVNLRRDVLAIISGVEDAEPSLWWDDTTPNYMIRSRLRSLLEGAIQDAPSFGVYIVTRHLDCGRRSHSRASDQIGYVWSDPYGLAVGWSDERFEWGGDQLYQGKTYSPCPCGKSDEDIDHPVIEDVIFKRGSDPFTRRVYSSILSDVRSAIEQAGDKQPRSGIREHLLRATIQLNDLIMPRTVDAYIDETLATATRPA